MALDPPPPAPGQQPILEHSGSIQQDRQRKLVRTLGAVLACSTPFTGLVSWAMVAVVIGEDRLEGPTSSPVLSGAAFLMPLVVGLVIVAWSYLASDQPDPRILGFASAVCAFIFIGLALWNAASTAGSGDASIGAGLLLMAGVGLAAAAWALIKTAPPKHEGS